MTINTIKENLKSIKSDNNIAFWNALIQEIISNSYNSYGLNYWDYDRFGKPRFTWKQEFKKNFIDCLNNLLSKSSKLSFLQDNSEKEKKKFSDLKIYLSGFYYLYNLLFDDYSKEILIKIIVYRIMGYEKVSMLSAKSSKINNKTLLFSLINKTKKRLKVKFNNWNLDFFELRAIGFPVNLYYVNAGVSATFILKQYEYKNKNTIIKANDGDYVIDSGGCWGDTALYFANEVGINGQVFTCEFIPSNLEIMKKNINLNPLLRERITIVENPLWEESEQSLYFMDNGPASRVAFSPESKSAIQVKTVTIDDLVKKYKIAKVNMIKMDIEGSELSALKGAVNTISKYRPKLALSVYHGLEDFEEIPRFLDTLNLGYRFYLDHFTLHLEETILFANVDFEEE